MGRTKRREHAKGRGRSREDTEARGGIYAGCEVMEMVGAKRGGKEGSLGRFSFHETVNEKASIRTARCDEGLCVQTGVYARYLLLEEISNY